MSRSLHSVSANIRGGTQVRLELPSTFKYIRYFFIFMYLDSNTFVDCSQSTISISADVIAAPVAQYWLVRLFRAFPLVSAAVLFALPKLDHHTSYLSVGRSRLGKVRLWARSTVVLLSSNFTTPLSLKVHKVSSLNPS